jgi:hypothetical protein
LELGRVLRARAAGSGEELDVHRFYRAMDFLAEVLDELREYLYFQVRDLLNADVWVLFYDTISVSFRVPVPDEEGGLRRLGQVEERAAGSTTSWARSCATPEWCRRCSRSGPYGGRSPPAWSVREANASLRSLEHRLTGGCLR